MLCHTADVEDTRSASMRQEKRGRREAPDPLAIITASAV